MLQLNQLSLSPQEIESLRKWLTQPEASLLRRLIEANAIVIANEAATLLMDGVMQEDHSIEAARIKTEEAIPFHHTLSVLEAFLKEDANFFRLTATVM